MQNSSPAVDVHDIPDDPFSVALLPPPVEVPQLKAPLAKKSPTGRGPGLPKIDIDLDALMSFIVGGGTIKGYARKIDPDNFEARSITISRLIASTAENTRLYEVATIQRAMVWADEIVEISDEDCTTAVFDRDGKETGRAIDHAKVRHNALRVDSRKWVACHLLPKYAKMEETRELGDALSTLIRKMTGSGRPGQSSLPIAQRVDDVEG